MHPCGQDRSRNTFHSGEAGHAQSTNYGTKDVQRLKAIWPTRTFGVKSAESMVSESVAATTGDDGHYERS
jgi:hypothetical protein